MEFRQPVLVHKDLEHTKEEIAECLVKLGRMLRFCLAPELEYESPWKICDITIDLGIEEVTQADECRRKAYCDCKMVKNPDEIKVVLLSIMLRKPPHCDKECDSSSVTGQTSLPRHEYLPESLPAAQIIVWLIEQTVSQAGTYDSTDEESVEKRIKKGLRHSLTTEEASEDEPSENESRYEKQ